MPDRLFSMVRPLQTADASGRRTYKLQGFLKKTICRESEDSRDMQKHSSK